MKFNRFNIIASINAVIALIIFPIFKVFNKNKNIWLIGGHLGELYDDNSKALYEYLLENKKDISLYWIANKNSFAEKNLKEILSKTNSNDSQFERKNMNKAGFIYRGTIKNFLYSYRAEMLVVSHSLADVSPAVFRFKKLVKARRVFISHGVEGFKVHKDTRDYYRKYFDLQFAVSDTEKNIKINCWRIDESKVKITGMPRYDKLNYDLYEKKRDIVYIPTWRDWLVNYSDEDFYQSDYFKKTWSLFNNNDLYAVLKKNNVKLNIYMHWNMHRFLKKFNISDRSDYINIIKPGYNVQKLIIENSVMITDYSSVAWDFFYMEKPVVFYQFDYDDYMRERGSYLDMSKELFGDVVYDENKLVKIIEEIILTNFSEKAVYKEKRKKYFKYIDYDNSKRVVNEIEKFSGME